jgi:putative membrane protein
MNLEAFPAINATLNSLSALFILSGFILIKKQKQKAHIFCMVSACVTSALFLACYLYYHFHHGSTPFQGQGFIRIIYFVILISHTILATAVVPFVFISVWTGSRGNYEKHIKISRKTFPIWLYVSITGVVIYWMLYQMGF